MKNDKFTYALTGGLVGGLVIWLLATTAVRSNNTGMMQMMGMNIPANTRFSSEQLDAHFIEQMIPHHEDAITMAKLAETKAVKPEVKKLAEDIITSQSKEIDKMKSWYKSWFGRSLPADKEVMSRHGMMGESQMHMGMMGNNNDLTRLSDAQDFDRVFVEDMIPHHQMAVMMASMLKDGTIRPEMKTLAANIIAAQTKEIDMMRSWLTNWNK